MGLIHYKGVVVNESAFNIIVRIFKVNPLQESSYKLFGSTTPLVSLTEPPLASLAAPLTGG